MRKLQKIALQRSSLDLEKKELKAKSGPSKSKSRLSSYKGYTSTSGYRSPPPEGGEGGGGGGGGGGGAIRPWSQQHGSNSNLPKRGGGRSKTALSTCTSATRMPFDMHRMDERERLALLDDLKDQWMVTALQHALHFPNATRWRVESRNGWEEGCGGEESDEVGLRVRISMR